MTNKREDVSKMARQNTFTILPPVPHFNPGVDTPSRPMTSKQVRKAHKAATKTPTMTRAERAKWERAEQERIRKEMDKERAAAKARAAREKKREKETQQREEKRRNGMPLVNVRPSQDTIARFVRGNGSAKKRDVDGLAVAETAEPQKPDDADATTPQPEVQSLGSIKEAEEDIDDETLASVKIEQRARVNTIDNASKHTTDTTEKETTRYDDAHHKNSKKPTETFLHDYDVDLSFEEPIDEAAFDAALDLVPVLGAGELPRIPPASEKEQSDKHVIKEAVIPPPSQDLLDEDINTDMLEELDELLSGGKTPAKPVPARPFPSPKPEAYSVRANASMHRSSPKISSASPREGRRTCPSQRGLPGLSSPRQARQAPPMATQAILTNVDDFFPTSSQQMRELAEEQEASQQDAPPQRSAHQLQQISSPSNQARIGVVAGCQPVTKPEPRIEDPSSEFGSFPSTSHFSLSGCYTASHPTRTTSKRHQQAAVSTPQPAVSEPMPAASPVRAPESARFFTSSGSREQLSLAMQRSRRSAALEQIQEKDRRRQEAGLLMRQATRDDAMQERQPTSPTRRRDADDGAIRKATTAHAAEKENVQPEMRCSQETEYGGDWVEDAAWDLALC